MAPLVTVISENQTYERGDRVTINCLAIGGPDIFYQWLVNDTDISGETSTTLMISNVNASTGGKYSCVVYNSAGDDTTSTFVFISPYFTTQPEDRGGYNGSNIILLCEAAAFPAPYYQWARVNGPAVRDNVLGVNSTKLSFKPLMFGDGGTYMCNATSRDITIQSNLISLRGNLKSTACYHTLSVNLFEMLDAHVIAPIIDINMILEICQYF